MNNLNVFEYLNHLSKSEFKRFEYFLNSPYFNKYKTILILFGYLKTKYPNIKKIDVTASRISLIVYSEETVNNSKIRKLISDFIKLFGNFLFHDFCDKRSLITKVHYLEYLKDRNMSEFYFKNLNEANSLLGKTNVKDDNYYLSNFKLSRLSALFNFNFRFSNNIEMFNSCLENIDFHFLYWKMWSFLNILFIKDTGISSVELNNNFEQEVITFIEANNDYFSKHHHFIYMLYLVFKMFSTMDDKFYCLFTSYFEENKKKFRGRLESDYFVFLQFYLRKKLRMTCTEYNIYNKRLYILYIQLFDSPNKYKFLLINGMLERSLYITVVAVYMTEGDSERALKFIHRYKKYLEIKFSEDTINYSLGVYFYYMHDIHNSIKYFNKVSSKNQEFKYKRKIFLLIIYFELNDRVLIETEMKNLYLFGYRLKDDNRFKQWTIVFLKYYRKLLKLKSLKSGDNRTIRFEKNIILKQIENEKQILHNKNWFVEMLKQF